MIPRWLAHQSKSPCHNRDSEAGCDPVTGNSCSCTFAPSQVITSCIMLHPFHMLHAVSRTHTHPCPKVLSLSLTYPDSTFMVLTVSQWQAHSRLKPFHKCNMSSLGCSMLPNGKRTAGSSPFINKCNMARTGYSMLPNRKRTAGSSPFINVTWQQETDFAIRVTS